MKEALWLKDVIGDFGTCQEDFTFCDSENIIHLIKNQMYHERTKNIDVRMHFIHNVITRGDMLMDKITTFDNLADMMIKVLPSVKFKYCLDLVGIYKC